MELKKWMERLSWSAAIAVGFWANATAAQAQSCGCVTERVSPFAKLFSKSHGCNSCNTCNDCTSSSTMAPSTTAPAQPDQSSTSPDQPSDMPSNDVLSDAFGSADAPASVAPNMMGDYLGYSSYQLSSSTVTAAQAQFRSMQRFKIADNNSPMIRQRIYYGYNNFQRPFGSPGSLNRNTAGTELPFLSGLVSADLRINTNGWNGQPAGSIANGNQFGDMFLNLKGQGYNNGNGTIVTGGCGIVFPTGVTDVGVPGGNAIVSPWMAFLYAPTGSNFYAMGFMQTDLPFAREDRYMLQTDVAGGYWVYRDATAFLSGLAPQVELHAYNPYGAAPSGSLTGLQYHDVLNATWALNFLIRNQLSIAAGLGTPLSTRKDYNVEAQVQVNWFYGLSAPR